MFDIALRQWKDALVDPVARLVPSWISPGQVTAAAFLAGLSGCYAATSGLPEKISIFLWIINRFLDCIDGSLARHRNIASELGGFLDLLSDFIIYSLLPIAIAYRQEQIGIEVEWVSIAFLEATFHVNNFILFYIAAVAAQKDDRELTSVTMRPALIEGFESGLLFTGMLVWPQNINIWARLMSVGVIFGIIQRTLAVISVLNSKKTAGVPLDAAKKAIKRQQAT